MRYDTLELLWCPVCRAELSLQGKTENGVIPEGRLHCEVCGHDYPIEKGIPGFIAAKELVGLNRKEESSYNWLSHVYDLGGSVPLVRSWFYPSGEEKSRREVVGRLEIHNDSKVLETGIGTGRNIPSVSSYARGVGVRVYGLDISIGMLNQCVKNLKKWKLEADLFMGNAEELPFRDECFDVVFHSGGINLFSEKSKAVGEMIRVAKSGTRIVIADETERAIGKGGILTKAAMRLFYGRRLAADISSFRSEDMVKLIPGDMTDVCFDRIWEGLGYRLEFRKP